MPRFLRTALALTAAALAVLSPGCEPSRINPDKVKVMGRSGRSRRRLRGARLVDKNGDDTVMGRLRGARIVSGDGVTLGRVRKGDNFFDAGKAGRHSGSLAEWALTREKAEKAGGRGRAGAGTVPSPGSLPTLPGVDRMDLPTLAKMRDLIPSYLADADVRYRMAGCIAAAHWRERSVVPTLCGMVQQNDPAAVAATMALGAIGDPRAVPTLAAAMEAGNIIAAEATVALGNLGGRASERPLIRALSSKNFATRIRAAGALGRSGASRRVRSALRKLADDETEIPDVRLAAAAALSRTGEGESVIEALTVGAASPVAARAAMALRGLAHIDDPRAAEVLASSLSRRDPAAWRAGLWGLLSSRSPYARRLLDHMASGGASASAERARLGLALSGAPGTERLLGLLIVSSDPVVRAEAATAMGWMGEAADMDVLASALATDGDVRVRRAAAYSIGRLGRPEGIKHLSRAVGDDDPVLRAVALAGMAAIRGDDLEKLADREKVSEAELAEQARILSAFRLARVIARGDERWAEIRTPEGRASLVKLGDEVYAGFKVSAIFAPGDEPAPGRPRLESGRVLLTKAGRTVVLKERR